MELLKDVLLVLSVIGVFAFLHFWIARLDRFLDENRKTIKMESEKQEPSCILLTEAMSDEEIVEEIKRFRDKHEETRVVLYDESESISIMDSSGLKKKKRLS